MTIPQLRNMETNYESPGLQRKLQRIGMGTLAALALFTSACNPIDAIMGRSDNPPGYENCTLVEGRDFEPGTFMPTGNPLYNCGGEIVRYE